MDVEKRKERLGKHMIEVIKDQLTAGTMDLQRAKMIARYYLERIKNAGNHLELTTHVETMLTELPEMHLAVRSDKIMMTREIDPHAIRKVI